MNEVRDEAKKAAVHSTKKGSLDKLTPQDGPIKITSVKLTADDLKEKVFGNFDVRLFIVVWRKKCTNSGSFRCSSLVRQMVKKYRQVAVRKTSVSKFWTKIFVG